MGRRQLERLIRSAKTDHDLPDGFADRVQTATKASQVTEHVRRRSLGRMGKLAAACAAVLAATLVAATMVRQHGGEPPSTSVRSKHEVSVAPEQQTNSPLLVAIAVRPPVIHGTGEALEVGGGIRAGATVRTGAAGRVTLITRRGSEFTLSANTELALSADGRSASLRGGRLYCRSRLGEFAALATPAGRIQLLGTTVHAAIRKKDTVAVTVVEGKVRLSNAHGEALVDSGRKALLIAALPPGAGEPVNTGVETAWYYGRSDVVSDCGDIAYLVVREDAARLACEVWAMDPDGSNKRRLRTYLGVGQRLGPWLPGQEWLTFKTFRLRLSTKHFEGERVRTDGGLQFLEIQDWLINARTGQDLPFALPSDYTALYTDLSPDGSRLAFCGSYQPDPEGNAEDGDWGVWVFDMSTGEVKKLLDGDTRTPISWAPDGRRLVADSGQGYVSDHPLVVADAHTGEVRDLGVSGAGGIFSPDGHRVAYSGEFQRGGSYFDGVPTSGRIMVYDLEAQEAIPVSPPGEGALHPRWSPDGSSIAYSVTVTDRRHEGEVGRRLHQALFIAAADGSGTQKVLESVERISGYAWTDSSDALCLVTENGIRVVAADGSGLVADLGGNAQDSLLTPEQDRQTQAALQAVREAAFQCAVGCDRSFEGKPGEARAAYQTASDIYAGLAWEYPLAQFSLDQLLLYADSVAAEANRSATEVLARSCHDRMSYLERSLLGHVHITGEFPSDLAAAQKRFLESHALMDHISSEDTDWLKMMLRCPDGGPYNYHRPSGDPQIGDVIVTCSAHPDNALIWTEDLERQLAQYREDFANTARVRTSRQQLSQGELAPG